MRGPITLKISSYLGAKLGAVLSLPERDWPLVLSRNGAQLQDGLEQVLAVDIVEAVIKRLGIFAVFCRVLECVSRLFRWKFFQRGPNR